jgi:hypothetical protein
LELPDKRCVVDTMSIPRAVVAVGKPLWGADCNSLIPSTVIVDREFSGAI